MDNGNKITYSVFKDEICNDYLESGIITKFKCPLITVYCNTKDYPNKFVTRLFDIGPNEVYLSQYIIIADSLEEIRAKAIPGFMTCLNRYSKDDPVIVETWI